MTEKTPESTALVPAQSEYITMVKATRDPSLATIKELIEKYEGKEKEQLQVLIESVNPVQEGFEEMTESFSIPVLRIVQGMTRDRPEGCQNGDLFSSFGSKIEKPFRFIPLYGFKMNRMFPPQGETLGRPLCIAPDGVLGSMLGECRKCPNLPLGENQSGAITDCDSVFCFIVLSETMRLIRLEFQKTSRKVGTRIRQLLRERPKAWDRWLSITTASTRSEKGPDYYVFQASTSGQETPNHLREAAVALKNMIEGERKAFLKQHYQTTLKGSARASATDEHVDLEGMNVGGTDNPDLTGGSI